jgi:hypothetical protein
LFFFQIIETPPEIHKNKTLFLKIKSPLRLQVVNDLSYRKYIPPGLPVTKGERDKLLVPVFIAAQ